MCRIIPEVIIHIQLYLSDTAWAYRKFETLQSKNVLLKCRLELSLRLNRSVVEWIERLLLKRWARARFPVDSTYKNY